VRVAVIDSGVNTAHPHIGPVAGGVTIGRNGEVEPGFTDLLGHGTAVMAAIQEKGGAADYYAIRVFRNALRTSSLSLARAIEWAIGEGMEIVNLSLGTANPAHAALLAPLVERACAQGVRLVAAKDVEGTQHYPGSLRGVVGVRMDPACPRDEYRLVHEGDEVTYFASGYPRPAPGIPTERNLQGISFAVANVSGLLVRGAMR